MKWLARLISLVLFFVYYILLLVLLQTIPYDTSGWWSVPFAVCYALFMIITMGALFSSFPEPLQKYFRNKTPDNPDGCG